MDSCEKFSKASLLDKEAFCGSLYMEDITDVDHRHEEYSKALIIKILVIVMTWMFKVIHYY